MIRFDGIYILFIRFNTIKIVILELIEEEIEENADGGVWKYSFSSDNRCWNKAVESNLRCGRSSMNLKTRYEQRHGSQKSLMKMIGNRDKYAKAISSGSDKYKIQRYDASILRHVIAALDADPASTTHLNE
jgi:hypothetical protein